MPQRDLFGHPIAPSRGAGRPRHEPTKATRALVKRRADRGVAQPAIAAELGITIPTLCRHYARQLGSGSKLGHQYYNRRSETK
jgi:hypothetical protein